MKNVHIIFVFCLLFIFFLCGNILAKDYNDYIKEGNNFYKEAEFQRAVNSYKEALKIAGNNVKVYYNLGLAYRQLKDYPSSVESFEKFAKVGTDKRLLAATKKLINEMSEVLSKPTTIGKLKNYEVWEGWILIEGDVIIPKDITLTIKPGSLIMFTPLSSRYDGKTPYLSDEDTKGFSSLIVLGTLIAEGEKGNEILFSNSFEDLTTKRIGLWGGIILEGSKDSILMHVKIERAKFGLVLKDNPDLLFRDNTFLKNDIGIKVFDNKSVMIDYSIFYRNETAIECLDDVKGQIINCNFTKNNYGVKVTGSAKPEIVKCTFDQNNCGVGTYKKAFPKIIENTFKDSKFGISLTENSKALIMDNQFQENKIGINSVNNSAPRIYQNTFTKNVLTGITAINNSTAQIDANSFISNNIGISKTKSVEILKNKYEDNTENIKEIE